MLRITGFCKILFFFLHNYCFLILQKLFILLKIGPRDMKENSGPEDAQDTRAALLHGSFLRVSGETPGLWKRAAGPALGRRGFVLGNIPREEAQERRGDGNCKIEEQV